MGLEEELSAQPLWVGSGDGLLLVDDDGRIRATNPALDVLFGYERAALVGEPVEVLVPEVSRSVHRRLRSDYSADPSPRPMAASRHLEGVRADGTTFALNVSLSPLETSEGAFVCAAVRDLSDRIRVEREAARAARLQALADDHDRIARDLHDTVIQRLFAVGLTLESGATRGEDPDLVATVELAVDTIDDVIRDIRNTIFSLRQDVSTEDDFVTRIAAILIELEPTLGFRPTLEVVGDLATIDDAGITSNVIPVLREGLVNVARHAEASQAHVLLRVDADELELRIEDDGVGIAPTVVRSGLANMADRALALRGRFEVRRAGDRGTYLHWSVPLEEPAA